MGPRSGNGPRPLTALRRSIASAAAISAIYVLPALLAVQIVRGASTGEWVPDFDANIWQPPHDVVHGVSPYPPADLAALTGHPTFVYPPLLLWVGLPLSALPHDVARVVFALICGLAVLGGLRAVGVRDTRCHAIALLSLPVIFGLVMGNPTILLVLPLALAWRYRDRPWVAGIAVACVVGIKPLLWPLGVWLLATRRFRAIGAGVVAGGAALVGTWAAIGFHGLTEYPKLVHMVGEKTAGPRSLSVSTLAHDLGIASGGAHAIQWLAGLALLAFVLVVASREDGDRRAFSLAVVAALVISPVAWLHYLALLFVPLAIARPAYGRAWNIPLALWLIALVPKGSFYYVTDHGHTVGQFGVVPSAAKVAITLGVTAAIAVVTARGATRRAPLAAHLDGLRRLVPQRGVS